MCVCMCVHVWVCVHVWACLHMCACVCMWECVCMCVCACVCACVCMCMCGHVHVCGSVCPGVGMHVGLGRLRRHTTIRESVTSDVWGGHLPCPRCLGPCVGLSVSGVRHEAHPPLADAGSHVCSRGIATWGWRESSVSVFTQNDQKPYRSSELNDFHAIV